MLLFLHETEFDVDNFCPCNIAAFYMLLRHHFEEKHTLQSNLSFFTSHWIILHQLFSQIHSRYASRVGTNYNIPFLMADIMSCIHFNQDAGQFQDTWQVS